MNTTNILDHFSVLEDPRQSWKILYPLSEILLVVLCGVMAGADDFVEIERWAKRKLGFLRRLLPFHDGICSHDTLNDVMNALPVNCLANASQTGWRACVMTTRRLSPLMARHRGVRMLTTAARCIWYPHGQVDKGWFWGKSLAMKKRMKSAPYPGY